MGASFGCPCCKSPGSGMMRHRQPTSAGAASASAAPAGAAPAGAAPADAAPTPLAITMFARGRDGLTDSVRRAVDDTAAIFSAGAIFSREHNYSTSSVFIREYAWRFAQSATGADAARLRAAAAAIVPARSGAATEMSRLLPGTASPAAQANAVAACMLAAAAVAAEFTAGFARGLTTETAEVTNASPAVIAAAVTMSTQLLSYTEQYPAIHRLLRPDL